MQDVNTRATSTGIGFAGVGDVPDLGQWRTGRVAGRVAGRITGDVPDIGQWRPTRPRDTVRSMFSTNRSLSGLGALDPGLTATIAVGTALSAASLPVIIGAVLWATKSKNAAKALFALGGIFAAVAASTTVFAAQRYAETEKFGL